MTQQLSWYILSYATSVARLTQKPEVPGSIPDPATYFQSPSADSNSATVSYWLKYVHFVIANRLGDLSLPRNSKVMLIDRSDMTTAVYRRGAPIAEWVKRWPTDLADQVRSPLKAKSSLL